MPIATSSKVTQISEARDPKQGILDAIGDLSGVTVFFDLVLIGTYIPSQKIGNVWVPQTSVGENEFQGRVGLVLKKGPNAFVDDEYTLYNGQNVDVGEWIVYSVGDAKQITINGTPCRYLKANQIRMKIKDPNNPRIV